MRQRFRRTAVLVVLAVAQAIAVVLMHKVFVTTNVGQYVETASITGARIPFDHVELLVDAVLNIISVAAVLAALAVVVIFALLRRRFVLAGAMLVMVVGANLTTQLLKKVVLDRPELPATLRGAVYGSMENTLPSGHTTVALSLAVAFLLVMPRRLRGVTALLAAGYGALTGVGTLSAQWHRPSDVIAAGLVVGAWSAAVGAVAVLLSRRQSPRDAERSRSLPLLSGLGVAFVALGGLILVLLAATEPSHLGTGGLLFAYLGGALGIAGSCAALVAGVVAIAPWVVGDAERLPSRFRPRRREPEAIDDAPRGDDPDGPTTRIPRTFIPAR